jgi:hypothetical protein
MVQIIDISNPQGKLAESLGMSLGQGLSSGLNSFFLNRSLESVMKDKSLENASPSKKFEALLKATAPYGEKGQQEFKNRLLIEEQAAQEKETAKKDLLQKKKSKALTKYFKNEPLTEEEETLFTPSEFTDMYKARNPKSEGGVTAQPIPEDINQKRASIINASKDLSADALKSAFDDAGIPPIYSNPYIENRRREDEKATEHDIKFHQESEDFEQSVKNNANIARKQIPLLEKGIKSVEEGKITPSSLANIFSYFGNIGKKISNALLSGDEASLLASTPEFLEGRKEIFGIRLSDADLRILQDKLPDIGKNKEANLAIFNLMKRNAEKAIKLEKIAENVLEKKGIKYRSGKLRPLGYQNEVTKAFDQFIEKEGTFEQPPSPEAHAGKIIEDESGRRYKSNGITWVPI